MRDGFIRTAAATPKIKVADPVHNREAICRIIEEYEKKGAELLVFPELCLPDIPVTICSSRKSCWSR